MATYDPIDDFFRELGARREELSEAEWQRGLDDVRHMLEGRAAVGQHVDFVRLDWQNGTQKRFGWVLAEYLRDHLAPSPDGSYMFRTDPHDDAECPFVSSEEIPFRAARAETCEFCGEPSPDGGPHGACAAREADRLYGNGR